jgi:hypothetical protein
MLEAGVSAALEIARFWGIAGERRVEAPREARAQARPEPQAANDAGTEGSTVGDGVMAAVSGHVPSEVQAVIARALKTAGLMR